MLSLFLRSCPGWKREIRNNFFEVSGIKWCGKSVKRESVLPLIFNTVQRIFTFGSRTQRSWCWWCSLFWGLSHLKWKDVSANLLSGFFFFFFQLVNILKLALHCGFLNNATALCCSTAAVVWTMKTIHFELLSSGNSFQSKADLVSWDSWPGVFQPGQAALLIWRSLCKLKGNVRVWGSVTPLRFKCDFMIPSSYLQFLYCRQVGQMSSAVKFIQGLKNRSCFSV